MTKVELIEKIAAGAKISKTDAAKALDVTLDSIKTGLKRGQVDACGLSDCFRW